VELVEDGVEGLLCDLLAALDGVVAVHQHLGFDDRHQPTLLAEGRVPRQCMAVGDQAGPAGDALADGDHRPPLGEARAQADVLGDALAQPVQALGDLLAGVQRQVLGAGVDLDPRDDPVLGEKLGEGGAVERLLADGLVVEDDPADVLGEVGGAEEHVAIGLPVGLGALDAEGGEPLADRPRALVRGENALVGGHHGPRDGLQIVHAHTASS
jgi:hypothetical protein